MEKREQCDGQNTKIPRALRRTGSSGAFLSVLDRQDDLRDEFALVLMLRRPLQIDVAKGAAGCFVVRAGVVHKLPRDGGQRLVGAVMVKAERPGRRQRLDKFAMTFRRDGHAERYLGGTVDRIFHEVHSLGDVRAVGAHGRERGISEQHRLFRHGRGLIGAAIDGLPGKTDIPDLRGRAVCALAQLFDMAIQLIPQQLQPADQRRQGEGAVKVAADLAEGQPEVLEDADGADLGEGVNGIVTVARGAVLDVRLDQPKLLIVKDDAAGDADGPCDLADGK